MKKRIGVAVAVAGVALMSTLTHAQDNPVAKAFAELEKQRSSGQFGDWMTYVSGVGNGVSWANTTLAAEKRESLYCPPLMVALNASNYAEIARHEYNSDKKRYEKLVEFPANAIAYAVLNGLMKQLPCN